MKLKIFLVLLLCLSMTSMTLGADFTPQGNIDLIDYYNITGAPYINATLYYGNGSQLTGITSTSANSSDYWDDYDTVNTTWFQNIAGALSLKLSQLTIWTDSWLSDKTTDDLTEGSTNLYDNRSWNKSGADDDYVNIDGDTMLGDLDMSGNNIINVSNYTGEKINVTCCVYLGNMRSYNGNSINIQPTSDEDDFFSFKTPAHRPTIKREGGKFIYIESSNVYDVGISARKDDTYSGTIAYAKDDNIFKLLGKNSPIALIPNSEYYNYILLETFNHQPQISVYNGTKLLINDSLEVNGIVNATGKVYSEGVEVLTSYSETDPIFTAWDNITGIPHATPSNGDTTHFSLADEIYDFVIALGYATTTTVNSLGNWSSDKSDYWNTSTDLDGVIATDEITELKIDFNTACAAGNHLYVNGNNLACEADDDTTYLGGNAITLADTTFNFDGGASPGGELGNTWASPTIDSGIHDDEYIELGDAFVNSGGEATISGTYGALVVTLGNDALDDQYYDSEADLTGLLNDNYEGAGAHFDVSTTTNITCFNSACTWYMNATSSCQYYPSGGKDCGAA